MHASPVVDLSNSFGAGFIGLIFCLVLFGLALAQTWMYFWHCWNKDTKALKSFIVCIIITATIQTALIVYATYWYLVRNFSNVEALAANKWFLTAQANFGGFYTTAIQWYYARQIYLLSEKMYPAIIIVTLTIGGTAVGYYSMIKEVAARSFADGVVHLEWTIILPMIEGVLVDFLITGFMCWALYYKRTGSAKTDSIIKTLMAYAVNTGLLTSLFGVAVAVTLFISPGSLIPAAFYYPMGTCYVNSVLALLNSRDFIRGRAWPENSGGSFALSSIRVVPPDEVFGSQSAFEGPKLASLLNAKVESRSRTRRIVARSSRNFVGKLSILPS